VRPAYLLFISISQCCLLNVGKISRNTDLLIIAGISLPVVGHTHEIWVLYPVHVTNIVAKLTNVHCAILRGCGSRVLLRDSLAYYRFIIRYNLVIWSAPNTML